MKSEFKNKFTNHLDGSEFFVGNRYEMVRCMMKIIYQYMHSPSHPV